MGDNDKWLERNCTAFLDSKKSDVELQDLARQLRNSAKKRGFTDLDVSAMYKKICKERKK